MSDVLHRVAPADLSVRGDGRTIYGLAVPYDSEATVDDGAGPYREVFRFGAFTRSAANAGKVKFLLNHDRKRMPIGRAISLREDKAGLIGEFRVSATRDGDEALELVRDSVLDSFSIGFRRGRERKGNGIVERLDADLSEVSLVAFPAYASAVVAGIRSATTGLTYSQRLVALRSRGIAV